MVIHGGIDGIPLAQRFGEAIRVSKQLSEAILDLALPPRCLVCRVGIASHPDNRERTSAPIQRGSSPIPPFCNGCLPPQPWPPPPCLRCCRGPGLPSGEGPLGSPCPICRGGSSAPFPIIHLGAHQSPLREMILAAKWGGGTELIPWLARWLEEAIRLALGSPLPIDGVVAVPRDWQRVLRFGKPLSVKLAQELCRRLRRPSVPAPRRQPGPPQTQLSASRRRNAPWGRFSLSPRRAAQTDGRTLLLVDDVYTTGATMAACSQVFNDAGATRVILTTLTATASTIDRNRRSKATIRGLPSADRPRTTTSPPPDRRSKPHRSTPSHDG